MICHLCGIFLKSWSCDKTQKKVLFFIFNKNLVILFVPTILNMLKTPKINISNSNKKTYWKSINQLLIVYFSYYFVKSLLALYHSFVVCFVTNFLRLLISSIMFHYFFFYLWTYFNYVCALSINFFFVQIGQRHGGFLGVLQRALARASPHIWFERSEVKDRSAVANRYNLIDLYNCDNNCYSVGNDKIEEACIQS